jgi:hypothetical protein
MRILAKRYKNEARDDMRKSAKRYKNEAREDCDVQQEGNEGR